MHDTESAFSALQRGANGYATVRVVLGLLLLSAALLKTHELATEPILRKGILEARWLLIMAVEVEILLGLSLLAGIHQRLTWRCAIACFAIFAAVSCYKGLSGEATCGCFGPIRVNPWWTFSLDAVVVLGLAYWRPARTEDASRTRQRASLAIVGTLWVFAGIPAALAMGNPRVATLGPSGDVSGEGHVVILEPEAWVGKRFPLLKYVDIRDELQRGEWIAILHYHGCAYCQDLVPRLPWLADQIGQSGRFQIALLEMAWTEFTEGEILAQNASWIRGRLRDSRQWIAETPVAVLLKDGQVTDVRNRERIAAMLERDTTEQAVRASNEDQVTIGGAAARAASSMHVVTMNSSADHAPQSSARTAAPRVRRAEL